MTLPFSDESLEVIEANECQGLDLTSSRFRRLFLEIDEQKAFRATVAAALAELRAEIVRLLCLADDADDKEESGTLAHLRDRLDATVANLGLTEETR